MACVCGSVCRGWLTVLTVLHSLHGIITLSCSFIHAGDLRRLGSTVHGWRMVTGRHPSHLPRVETFLLPFSVPACLLSRKHSYSVCLLPSLPVFCLPSCVFCPSLQPVSGLIPHSVPAHCLSILLPICHLSLLCNSFCNLNLSILLYALILYSLPTIGEPSWLCICPSCTFNLYVYSVIPSFHSSYSSFFFHLSLSLSLCTRTCF